VTASRPEFRRTDRTDAPLYLSRYTARRDRETGRDPAGEADDAATPLYLRRFRDRQDGSPSPARPALLEVDGERFDAPAGTDLVPALALLGITL